MSRSTSLGMPEWTSAGLEASHKDQKESVEARTLKLKDVKSGGIYV